MMNLPMRNRIGRRLHPVIGLLALLLPADPSWAEASWQDHWIEAMITTSATVRAAGDQAAEKAADAWDALEKTHPLACDWMQQDFQAQAWKWWAQPDAAVLRAMIRTVLAELRRAEPATWRDAEPTREDHLRDLLAFYLKACAARRTLRLQTLAETAPQLVFTRHWNLGGSHYAYTEGQSDAQAERHFYPGSALCLLTVERGACRVETLLEDKQGVIRDPDVSYDGKRILFSWKKSDREDDYHLYEMQLATRQIRQLTDGLGVADYEGVYLPDGDILFNSTRCVQIVDCWWTEVSNLYRCNADGHRIRRLTFDQVHDNYPTVTEDGRILYTRWEYNDRSQIYPQPLLQMMPDGTGQTEFYGVNSWFPTTILHARNVPGTEKVLAIATGHHSRQAGKLVLLDPAQGRQENEGAQLVAPVRATPADRIDAYGQNGELFQYPYPLNETQFLVSYHPVGWRKDRAWHFWPRFAVYLMDLTGRRELLAADPDRPCNQPIPLRPRKAPPPRPRLVDYQKTHGLFYVQDVYAGPALRGVPRGTIKNLRVVQLEFRAAGIGNNGNGGPGGGALISTPVAIGNGTWDPKTILGDATVYADGSALFQVPARTPVYFQLLDGKGRMVQSMRSWSTLQPGEIASCVGCHEHKNTTPPVLPETTLALRAGPESLKKFHDPLRGFSFPKDIQPILDARCVSCHDGKKVASYDLSARPVVDPEAKRQWTQSYLTLTHGRPERETNGRELRWRGDPDHRMVNWISAASVPTPLSPYTAGSNKSKLVDILEQGHEEVLLSAKELATLAAWIDLGVPFCGDYTEANTWSEAEQTKYQYYWEKRKRFEAQDWETVQALGP